MNKLKIKIMEKRKHNSLDDIVFENKNKAYGAYYNRLTAGFDLMKSLFITVFGVGIMALVLSFTVKEEAEIISCEFGVEANLIPIIKIPETIEKEKTSPAPKDKTVKTIKSDKTDIIPTPKDDVEKQTEMTDNQDISKVIHGDENIDGDENTGSKTPQLGGDDNGKGKGGDDENGKGESPAQPEKTVYTAREVSQMAIFPGCEKFAGKKDKLQTCLSEQLQKELGEQLIEFNELAHRQGINEAAARVQFIIDKSGKIVQVKTLSGGNVQLSKESKEALERISKRFIQKGKYIEPAKFEDGTPVNLTFTIPVKFISN